MPVFRVDSPMKGNASSKDEKLLSFQVVSIDTDAPEDDRARSPLERDPKHPAITWGESKTIGF